MTYVTVIRVAQINDPAVLYWRSGGPTTGVRKETYKRGRRSSILRQPCCAGEAVNKTIEMFSYRPVSNSNEERALLLFVVLEPL